MTDSNDVATPRRTTERIGTPSGDELDAWPYLPDGDGPHPAVVMGHGFAAVKAGGLQPFAERFQREGFAAIVFDYRGWGSSDGQPRDVARANARIFGLLASVGLALVRRLESSLTRGIDPEGPASIAAGDATRGVVSGGSPACRG